MLGLDQDEDGDAVLKLRQRSGSWYGKPEFPELEETESYDISDYIGPDSIGFFTILGLDTDFLEESVKDWAASPTYQAAKAAVKNLPVVNDAAERGVKITSDFLDSARNEERIQTVLQVAENDRRKMPNQRKRHMSEKIKMPVD